MHSKIFQITNKPVGRDNYINSHSFISDGIGADYFEEFADYVDDIYECEEQKFIDNLASVLRGIFEINGREMTFIGLGDFLQKWADFIKEKANELSSENIVEFPRLYNLRKATERTHLDIWYRFAMVEDDSKCYPDTFGEFIASCTDLKPGDKRYIGGIVDYHY